MKYLDVCSGISAPSVAWKPLGWEPVAYSEIERFPSAVLAHHYPDTPNWGDLNGYRQWPDADVDVLIGGTPCQSFSVAGLRKGLADPRGNLALVYLGLADRYRPAWVVWENVPGVLSSDGGRDFGAFLGGLAELGYGWAYRVLDAQYFGVPQRRRRVFVVGYLGDWRHAAAVLFDAESMSGNPAPGRCEGKGFAGSVAKSLRGNSGGIDREDMHTLIPSVANPLTARMHKGINTTLDEGQTPVVVHGTQDPDISDVNARLDESMKVRRLTVRECERLQGFEDDYTMIPYRGKPADKCPDGPRYKALGNSMAVPVIRWIGERITGFMES